MEQYRIIKDVPEPQSSVRLKKCANPWMDDDVRHTFNRLIKHINLLESRLMLLEGVGDAPSLGGKLAK